MNNFEIKEVLEKATQSFFEEKLGLNKNVGLFLTNSQRQKYRELDKLGFEELWKLRNESIFDLQREEIPFYLGLRGLMKFLYDNEPTGGPTPSYQGTYVWKEFIEAIKDYKKKADHFEEWQQDNPNEGKGDTITFSLPPSYQELKNE